MIVLLFFRLDIQCRNSSDGVVFFATTISTNLFISVVYIDFFMLHKCPSASLFIIHGFLSTFERYELFRTTQY